MKANLSIVAATLSILLTACGGGGGSSTSTTPTAPANPTAPTTPVVTPGDLQTTVPAATYAANSQEMIFFTAMNEFRGRVGLGLVAQSALLDQAAKNHVNYLLTNTDVNPLAIDPVTGRPLFHIEQQGKVGFTGVQEIDRAKSAGYAGAYVGELGAYGVGGGATKVFNDLASAIYHRQGLMFQEPRDIGISMGNDRDQTTVIEVGFLTTPQKNASDFLGVYPADKQVSIPLASYPEVPNPYPELTTADAIKAGTSYPISVISKASTRMAVSTFTVTEQGQVDPLPARLFTKDTDPNKLVQSNVAFLVGRAAFKPNTTYTVRFVGTVNDVAMSKTWSFTTVSK